MSMTINRRSLLATAALSVAGFVAGPAKAEETIKVGTLYSYSGVFATIGLPESDVVKILVDKYNAAGGINGRRIELIQLDDKSNPTEAARGATKLIHEDHVVAILGPTSGGSTLAVMPVAERAKIPVIAPIATISAVSKEHSFFPYIFRSCPTGVVFVKAMVKKVIFDPGVKRVGIMAQEDAYGRDETKVVQQLIKEHGGGIEIVEIANAPLTAMDLTPAATKLRNANPEVVLMLTSVPALGGAFARAAELAGLKTPLVGGISINQQPFIDAAGSSGENVMSLSIGNWNEPSSRQAELAAMLKAAGKQPAGYSELIGSTGIIVLVEAIKHVKGDITGQAIRDQLEKICGFNGTYIDGPLCFDADQHDGYGTEAIKVVQIKNGKWVNVK
jgi:branched-chain amino acid transport system substrate-binding protein